MSFAFATCERKKALSFLKKIYPENDVSEDNISDLLDLIERDEVRVTDPDFHRGELILGQNSNDQTINKATDALVKAGLSFKKKRS